MIKVIFAIVVLAVVFAVIQNNNLCNSRPYEWRIYEYKTCGG